MIERFQGEPNKSKLVEAIQRQPIVNGDVVLAAELSSRLELIQFEIGADIISQGNPDDDLYFLLSGRVSIGVNGREIAVRSAGVHFGEISLIDPGIPRIATVTTIDRTVVGKISESDFSEITRRYPELWRAIARHLSVRLRQRNSLVILRNPRPVIFIGSSTEALPIAKEIQSALIDSDFIVKIWTDKVFVPSRFPIEDLEDQVKASDFGILVFSSDDKSIVRGKMFEAPRDNVLFELGLFMGALTRGRAFIVSPKDSKVKIPSDLLGITKLEYTQDAQSTLSENLAAVCNELRVAIKAKGTK
ncbi:MAG TPA: TIR domain-containing protein [Pyrinomonadaceae bacterium]|jgi:predicted nucleotide-binding protein|nr:TIR domain-containing protein [Pyrinomonadaceae bacterium]